MTFIIDSRIPNEVVELANELIEDELFTREEFYEFNSSETVGPPSRVTYSIEFRGDSYILLAHEEWNDEVLGKITSERPMYNLSDFYNE
jgi:hypothetical protein